MVWVGPPLCSSELSNGSNGARLVPVRSLATHPVLPSVLPIRLWPNEVNGVPELLTSGPVEALLPATIVFRSVHPPSIPPPIAPPLVRLLLLIVQLLRTREAPPLLMNAPPMFPMMFPLKVQFVTVELPEP